MFSSARSSLNELSSRQQVFSGELDPRTESRFLEFYVHVIPKYLDAERCSIFVHDPANQKVWLKAGTAVKEHGIEVSLHDSVVGQAIASGKPVLTTGLEGRDGVHKAVDTTTGFVTREILCVPILSMDGKKITGAIQVLNKKGSKHFSEEDQRFLMEAGAHFQGIIESIFVGQEAVRVAQNTVGAAARSVALTVVGAVAVVIAITAVEIFSGIRPWFM